MSRKRLTPRDELRVAALHREGHTLAEIADRFGCSRSTVWNALHAPEKTVDPDATARISTLAEQARRHAESGCSSKSVPTFSEHDCLVGESAAPKVGAR